MTTLSLSLLGPFAAVLNGRSPTHFRSNRAQALLIYLAVERAYPHPREALMELLWPGLPQQSAQVNLRQTLYQLRQLTADEETAVPFLLADRHTAQINPDLDLELDIDRFSHLLGSHADQEQLANAATLYRGDFLCDFYLPDSAPFEEWAAARRADLRQQTLDGLDRLLTLLIQQEAYEDARLYALRQLEIDNLHERGHRQLMEILARLGQRSQALAQYEALCHLLQTELGAEPSPKTQALYEQIQRAEMGTAIHAARHARGYQLHEEIGAGAFGVVYRAVQPVVGREVAIKIIAPDYANQPDFIRRFEAEARIIARLEHPHIVPLYDYWRELDGAYLVMRWLRGGNLSQLLQKGPCDLETAVHILDQITAALAVAHRRSIVHRDIKPANILLDEEGNAYLSDFGIAKELVVNTKLTQQGAIVGSPAYLSPEQALGQVVTPQADIYSLGVVLYEMLTGEHPFHDTPISDLIFKHTHEPLPSTRDKNPALPPAVDSIIQQATAKSPDGRFPDARAMALALQEQMHGKLVPVALELSAADLVNPYKGLRPFEEADAADFYGRAALVEQLLARMAGPDDAANFLAVVGPSGSGKSSVVKAGLLPALRQGALPGSEGWFMVSMTPGTRPLDELEIGLLRIATRQQTGLSEQLRRDEHGLLRAARLALPDDQSTLLLLIDQFEELFTAVPDPATRDHFLNSLVTAVSAPHSPLRLLITLRADFYDRPLLHPAFGELMRQRTAVVLPLSAAELAQAIREPALGAGAELETGLVTAIVADVADQPGALPMLQYALTELFEKRQDHTMSLECYRAIGGISGALTQRAEELYANLDTDGQEDVRQLFLRLVTLGGGIEDTRRRVRLLELNTLRVDDPRSHKTFRGLGEVIDRYARYRILTFDSDPNTREPTVEVAHEALLHEWPRLRHWLDQSRDDIQLQRRLAAAAAEWEQSGRDEGFLLRGSRLDLFSGWMADSDLALTSIEITFLNFSLTARQQRQAVEKARQQHELETAQQLAETEKQRAEEQTESAQRLRQRALYLMGALVIAVLLAITAVAAGFQANHNAETARTNANTAATQEANAQANAELAIMREGEAAANAELAATREVEALRNASLAATRQNEAEAEANARATAEAIANQERETAEEQARLAFSRELVAGSILNLDDDPELSILLALHALEQADTFQAQEALHQAVLASRLLLRVPAEPGLEYYDALFSPDGDRISNITFSPQAGLQTQVRDAATMEILFTIRGGFFDDRWENGDRLHTWWANLDEGTITIDFWDGDGQQLSSTTLPVAWGDVAAWDVSPDMDVIAIAMLDGLITLFDLATGDALQTFGNLGDALPLAFGLVFSPDGTLLGSNGWEAFVLWEIASGRALLTRPKGNGGAAVTFSRDGKRLAYAMNSGGDMAIVDIASGQDVLRIFGHTAQIQAAEFNADGTRLVTTSSDGSTRIWNTLTGENLLKLRIDTSGNLAATMSPDGTRLVTLTNVGDIQVWGIGTEDSREWLTVSANGSCGIAYSPDGSLLAVTNCDDSVSILDAISGQIVMTLTSPTSATASINFPAFSPDGTRLAAVKALDTIVVWDMALGTETLTLSGHEKEVFDVAFSPDSSQLATISYDKTARLWDATSGEVLHSLDVYTDTFNTMFVGGNPIALAFSPDGSKLATAGSISVKVWDTATGEELLAEVGSGTYTVAFSPDGAYIAAGLMFGMGGRVWDAATGEKLFDLSGHTGSVTGIAYSPDGKQIATTSVDGTTRLWDAATGVAQLTLESRTDQGASVAYSPDGTRLAVQYEWGLTRIYALRPGDLVAMALSRLTRWFTPAECQQYLHINVCPPAPWEE